MGPGRERGPGSGTRVCPELIRADARQKPSLYCNYPPIKINKLTFLKKENHSSKPLLHRVTKAHKGLIPQGQLVVELDGEFKALNRAEKVDQIFHLILPILKSRG